jgi:hypothetical protein
VSADAVCEGFEAVFGDEAVDDVLECGEVVGREFGDGGEAVAEGVVGGVQGPAGEPHLILYTRSGRVILAGLGCVVAVPPLILLAGCLA